MNKLSLLIFVGVLLLISSCAKPPEPSPVVEEPLIEEPVVDKGVPTLQVVDWTDVVGWQEDNPGLALGALLESCSA
ncbi:MAG: hypothetical protein OEM65_07125, partial [Desulfuromonadales bacterium]|nr:hypothetical protein [Desulfuromonadales bacterium]MDH3869804.1 hypothetical protein [Desulfuromonadales bacterium]